jgi:hypothetical protein
VNFLRALALVLACAALLPASAEAFAVTEFGAQALAEGGTPATQAGSHPAALNLDVGIQRSAGDGGLRDLDLELPPGLLENPTAVPVCPQADFFTPRTSP